MIKTLQKIWEYFFAPWNIEVIDEGCDKFVDNQYTNPFEYAYYYRSYIKYRYTHKFRNQVKIIKQYID